MRFVLGLVSLVVMSVVPLIGGGAARLEATGTLNGTFKSVWLRKYSMIAYLEKVGGPAAFKPRAAGKPTIDQKDKRFVPHVLPVVQGTTIRYLNHDDTKHNVYFIQPDGKKVNLGTGRVDWSKDHTMDQAGVYVHHCNIHDEMTAYVFVGNPYYALVKKQASRTPAKFKIESVPAGDYKLHVWCEKFYEQKGHKFNRAWDVHIEAGRETTIDVKP